MIYHFILRNDNVVGRVLNYTIKVRAVIYTRPAVGIIFRNAEYDEIIADDFFRPRNFFGRTVQSYFYHFFHLKKPCRGVPCVPLDRRLVKADAFRFCKIEKQVEDLQSAERFDDVHRVVLAERVLQSFFLQRFNAEDCRPFVGRHRGAAFFLRGSAASQQ